jgi:threonine dehydrogenase-like Zn-dependent dehydrogenase
VKFPVVIGHEFSGEIVEVGEDVKDFKIGDLVVAVTMNWCGECMPCRSGLFNQCQNLEEIGFTLDGAYAEYLAVKSKFCFDIGDLVNVYGSKGKALEVAAMVEPTAVAYNGLFTRGGGFAPGGNVAVFGGGPIGLSAASLARAAGAAKIIVFEKKSERLALAEKVGADYVFNIEELKKEGKTPSQAVLEITKGIGVALVAEATHEQQETIREMEQMVAIGGTIVQIGISSERTAVMSTYLQKKGVNYHCSIGSSGHGIWSNVIRLIAAKRIDPSLFLTDCYGLDDALIAIEKAKAANGGKYIITPNW